MLFGLVASILAGVVAETKELTLWKALAYSALAVTLEACLLPILPVRLVLRYQLRTDKWIREVNCPVYILHGTKDWLIPIKHSIGLQKINPRKITLIRIHGGGHNNLPKFPEYHNFIRDILKD